MGIDNWPISDKAKDILKAMDKLKNRFRKSSIRYHDYINQWNKLKEQLRIELKDCDSQIKKFLLGDNIE